MKRKLLLLALVGCASFTLFGCSSSNKTQKELTAYTNDESKAETIHNKNLEVSVDNSTTRVTITDLKTNKTYYSNPSTPDVETYAEAKGQLKEKLNSTIVLTYSNKTDTQVDLNNYTNCIQDGNYSIEKVSDSEIDVHYTIGDIEKLFVCPLVIKKENMEKYLSQLSTSEQKSITRNYVYYDYKELSEDKDSNKLQAALQLFPNLKGDPVYYLSEKITDSKAKNLERLFKKVGYTEEQRNKDMEGYNVSRNANKPIFDVTVQYILDDNGEFVVNVPMEKIEYNSTYPIVKLAVLPYMGASNKNEEGYIIVPEGTGSMIRFNNGKTGQQKYQSDMYGWDYGISRDMVVDESKSNFPVYAISNQTSKESFVCIAEEGSSYSTVAADIAGKENGYNYGRFEYDMIHGENMDISSKSDTTVRSFEAGLPKENIKQRYLFSDQNDYVSLAVLYREYLMRTYPELVKKEDQSVPMAVELIGAVDNTEHILGYPVTRSLPLTKYKDAMEILKQLKASGIENLDAKYTGWFNTGVKQKSAAKVKLINRLGKKGDLKDLTSYANSTDGINLYLNGKFMYVMKNKGIDGFIVNRDAAKYVSREIAELYTLDPIIFQTNEDFDTCELYYLVKPSYTIKNVDRFMSSIKSLGAKNIAFEDIGNELAGDYNPKVRVSREKVMNMEAEKLKALKESGSNVMTCSGNQYAIPYSDYVTDLNIDARKVNITDEAIPFYQIAIHGLVNYSGSAINLSEDKETMILKSAETGAGLYFTFMNAPTSVLQDGEYTQFYACNFTDWKDTTLELYNRFNQDLGDTYSQFIKEHEKVQDGIYKTVYENGKTVYVNYNYADATVNGVKVPQRDFVVTGGGK